MAIRAVCYLLFAALALILMIRHIESRSIFFPMRGAPSAIENGPKAEDVFIETSDSKKLHGWFIPVTRDGAATVLFLHGNAGHIGHRWEKIRILNGLSVSVFIFDYRGYGRSEGKPSEAGIYRDVDAAYSYLVERGIAPENLFVYGESIGGAFAVDLALKKKIKALVLEDTFTSVPAMVRRSLPFIPAIALATRLDSLSKIRKALVPKLIFHSVDDEIVPFEMGEALFEAAPEPKKLVKLRGGHNTAFLDDAATYRAALAAFLAQ